MFVIEKNMKHNLFFGFLILMGTLVGVLFYFLPMSPLWLDEAQSAAISGESFSDLFDALRHDGHPPLYYFILGAWVDLFGDTSFALRALSGFFGVLSIFLTWSVSRLHMDRRASLISVVLMAISPFAIRYATEVRMYSMLIVLILLMYLVFYWTNSKPSWKRYSCLSLLVTFLLFTHYWSLFFVSIIFLSFLLKMRKSPTEEKKHTKSLMLAVVIGSTPFILWLPVFLDQLLHTGTPWAKAPRPTVVIALTLEAFGGGKGSEALLVAVAMSVLVFLGVFAKKIRGTNTLQLGWSELIWLKEIGLISLGTVLFGSIVTLLTDSAYQGRYGVFIFPFVILASSVALARLPKEVGVAVLAVFILLCVVSVARELSRDRTQIGEIAEAIVDNGKSGDLVVFCPDQLAPAGSRILSERFETFAYPNLDSGERVDWYDYEKRNSAADPAEVADQLLKDKENIKNIWLVWIDGFETFGKQCSSFRTELGQRLAGGKTFINADGDKYYNPSNLVQYSNIDR